MEQQDRKSVNFEEIVQRAVNAKAKAGLRSNTIIRDSDIHCPKSYHPSKNTAVKVQTQGTIVKDSYPKKTKTKDPKPILSYINMIEPLEQEKKD